MSKRPQLTRSRYSGRALSISQTNAQWDISELTCGATNFGARQPLSVEQGSSPDLASLLQSVHIHDHTSPRRPRPGDFIDADKVESLLKRLRTDTFAGSGHPEASR
jgi:hypothetical protein